MFQQGHSLPDALPQKVPSEVTLEKIMNGTFEAVRFNGTWVSGNNLEIPNCYFISIFVLITFS